MSPVGINFFHILVSLPESTNTLRSDFLSPISQKNKLRLGCEGGCVKCRTLPQLEGLLWILSKPKVCKEPGTRKSEGRGGAQARGERGRTTSARHREPADPAREKKPEETRDGDEARAPPAQGLPRAASVPLIPPPAGRGGARREHKRLQLPSGRRPTPPTPGLGPARGEEADRKRQGGRERARMGRAGDPGPRARVGVDSGGGGRELLGLLGLPRIAEERVSKNRQRLARISGRPKRNKEHPPHP